MKITEYAAKQIHVEYLIKCNFHKRYPCIYSEFLYRLFKQFITEL